VAALELMEREIYNGCDGCRRCALGERESERERGRGWGTEIHRVSAKERRVMRELK
jgi:hypothetical protein